MQRHARNLLRPPALLVLFLACAAHARAQSPNLLQNADGSEGVRHWRVFGDARAEGEGAERSFVLRDGGYLVQEVDVPENSVGGFAVLSGLGTSERADAGRARTGTACLYGYMENAGDPSGGRIYAYLDGQRMCARDARAGEWARLWGVFRVAPGTRRLSFFIKQGASGGERRDGSPTRFRELSVRLFGTEGEALDFAGARPGEVRFDRPKNGDVACGLWRGLGTTKYYGLRLGMSAGEIETVFPGATTKREGKPLAGPRSTIGEEWFSFSVEPYDTIARSHGVTRIWLKLLDGKLYSIYLDYGAAEWPNVDDFILSRAADWGLPPPGTWHVIQPISSRYLICDDVELRFYDTPVSLPNTNYVTLVNLAAEKESARRFSERDGAAARGEAAGLK